MAGFNDFVQTELPLRPFVRDDGAAGQILARSNNPLAPREVVWVDPTTSTGASPNQIVSKFITPNALSGGKAVLADLRYADSTDVSTVGLLLGITQGAAVAGGWVYIVSVGILNGLAGLTPFMPIYLSTNGDITQVPPTTGYIQRLGVAIASDTIYINISPSIIFG
jgi:hypothetical protein